MSKVAFIPKTKVEPKRRHRYELALKHRQATGEADLTLSDWIRQACDRQAAGDLAEPGAVE